LSRSRLRIPNAFPLPEIPGEQAIFAEQLTELPALLVGRETETRELARAVQNHRLTFLYGESGSGKSTVLKLGLARKALAALAKEAHGHQATRGADTILAQMQKTTDADALSSLWNALAALAAGFPGHVPSRPLKSPQPKQ
jgi:hypothetical protein